MAAAFGAVGGGDGGNPHFQLGSTGSLLVGGSTVFRMKKAGGAGIQVAAGGDAPNRPVVIVHDAQLLSQFLLDVDLDLDHRASLTLYGGGNPLDRCTVNLGSAEVSVHFEDETPAAVVSEHLGRFTVGGQAAVVGANPGVWETGDNLLVISDGGAGAIVTARP